MTWPSATWPPMIWPPSHWLNLAAVDLAPMTSRSCQRTEPAAVHLATTTRLPCHRTDLRADQPTAVPDAAERIGR
jgi:hypothetical protein